MAFSGSEPRGVESHNAESHLSGVAVRTSMAAFPGGIASQEEEDRERFFGCLSKSDGPNKDWTSDMKTVFTTGEAAKICKVSQQTIIRCFDSGQLKGFRVPGSRFRRIPRDVLYRFMKDNGIPTDALESGKPQGAHRR